MTQKRTLSPDVIAVAVLVGLWALFFWRVLTPMDADSVAFEQGDFSGQFVAFSAYQYDRMTDGEIPLWNPYNNSGLPFIADTQAAVFYPPRLLTIGFAWLTGGWRYHALMLEAVVHVLMYTLSMYALVRRMTDSVWGGLAAAIVGGYGGYLSGYPPLQLALLEAGVWLPLALLGIHEATRNDTLHWPPLTLTGLALGLSWLAGHPQTSWFLTYLAVAFWTWRVIQQKFGWRRGIIGVLLFGAITFGATAITFIPSAEYLQYTARAGFGYAAKQNGFPIQDIVQFIYPNIVSLFSPLYVGIVGLLIALYSLVNPRRDTGFWWGVFGVGLLLSFGGNTAFFPALYNLLPGLSYFRGQERAAYLVANSAALLVGLSFADIVRLQSHQWHHLTRTTLNGLTALTGGVLVLTVALWLGFRDAYGGVITPITFAFVIVAAAGFTLRWIQRQEPPQAYHWGVVLALLVFELFTVNMDAPAVYDNIPPADQLSMSAPSAFAPILTDDTAPPVRIDGFRGLMANYGSLYHIYDARGISPLFLDGLYQIQQPPFANLSQFELNPTFWELNAVRYVFSGFEDIPADAEKIGEHGDIYGGVFLYELNDPRPFAHLVYQADVVDSDAFARALLQDPRYTVRDSIILHTAPTLSLPDSAPTDGNATVTDFAPESFTVTINTPENAILSLAHPHYVGWNATLNDAPVPILRAYGGWSAVEIPAGSHTLTLTYAPRSFIIGAVLSIITWAALGIFGLVQLFKGES